MSIKQQTIPLRMRLLAIILGIVFLFWLPIEDTSTILATVLSISICFWLAVTYFFQTSKKKSSHLYRYIFAGTIAGALVAPLTLFIMAFKTGLHGHPTPDFTTQQILAVIKKTPIWILGGFLISLGSTIWLSNRQT